MEKRKYFDSTGFEPRIVRLYRLRYLGPRTYCVAYTTPRFLTSFLPRQESGQIHRSTKFHQTVFSRMRRGSKEQVTPLVPASRAFAFPLDMTHTEHGYSPLKYLCICVVHNESYAFLFSRLIRTRTRHYSKPLDRKIFFSVPIVRCSQHNL
jgi:hypothetical protein